MAPSGACSRLSRCAGEGSAYEVRTSIGANSSTTAKILWASPGSGTSWVRVLLELATGRSTNSVYIHDRSEGHLFCRQQPLCQSMVVKSHFGGGSECHGDLASRPSILLVRNPYSAMWSEYQRIAFVTDQKDPRSHGSAVTGTNGHNAFVNTLRIVHQQHLFTVAKQWKDITSRQLAVAARAGPQPGMVHWLFYEELLSPRRRLAALQRAALFLGVNVSEERAACAFNQSDVDELHRQPAFSAAEALVSAEAERARAATRSSRAHAGPRSPQQPSNITSNSRPGAADNANTADDEPVVQQSQKTVYDALWEIVGAGAATFGYARLGVLPGRGVRLVDPHGIYT